MDEEDDIDEEENMDVRRNEQYTLTFINATQLLERRGYTFAHEMCVSLVLVREYNIPKRPEYHTNYSIKLVKINRLMRSSRVELSSHQYTTNMRLFLQRQLCVPLLSTRSTVPQLNHVGLQALLTFYSALLRALDLGVVLGLSSRRKIQKPGTQGK